MEIIQNHSDLGDLCHSDVGDRHSEWGDVTQIWVGFGFGPQGSCLAGRAKDPPCLAPARNAFFLTCVLELKSSPFQLTL